MSSLSSRKPRPRSGNWLPPPSPRPARTSVFPGSCDSRWATQLGSRTRRLRLPQYKRILLKLSGEALAGEAGFGLDGQRVRDLAGEVAGAARSGEEIGIVVGG